MSGEVHHFQGRTLSPSDLNWSSYSELLAARSSSRRTFLKFYSKGRKHQELTFADFCDLTRSRAAQLLESGHVERGRPVVVLLGNSFEAFIAYSALMTIGAIVMPVDPAETVDYVLRVAKVANASAAIGPQEWFERLEHEALPFCNEFSASSSPLTIDSTFATRFDEPASLFFTSGTTGDSKGVLQTLGAAFVNAEGTRRAGLLTNEDKLFSCLPLYHVNAFNFSFLLPLVLECSVIYLDGFTPAMWQILKDERATVASLSPPLIRLLLKDNRRIEPSADLRYVVSASSALHHSDIQGMRERYGARVCQAYGLSETINFTLFTPPDLSEEEYAHVLAGDKLPSAGIAVWGQAVEIVDENGALIKDDSQPGEIVVRGWNVMREYLNNSSATRQSFEGDRFHTGDVAYAKMIEGRRYFVICGRIKETAKRSGVQIYLSEIDQVARDIGLEMACAVAFENAFTQEEIGLFLVRSENDNRSQAELLASFEHRLPFAKRPKVIVEGAEIPKTSVGKIRRNELKKAFLAYASTRFQDR